jgi:hypothetical protein
VTQPKLPAPAPAAVSTSSTSITACGLPIDNVAMNEQKQFYSIGLWPLRPKPMVSGVNPVASAESRPVNAAPMPTVTRSSVGRTGDATRTMVCNGHRALVRQPSRTHKRQEARAPLPCVRPTRRRRIVDRVGKVDAGKWRQQARDARRI